MKKSDLIINIFNKSQKKDSLFEEFFNAFYQHVSLGYLKNICKNSSKNALAQIAELTFELFKKNPEKEGFSIEHHLLQNDNLQVLLLHCFDKPFVVRSIKVWLSNNKLIADEFIHPVYKPTRSDSGLQKCNGGITPESIIAVILPIDAELFPQYKESLQKLHIKLSLVVNDFPKMQEWIECISGKMLIHSKEHVRQAGSFLNWLNEERFVFLGIRYYKISNSSSDNILFEQEADEKYGMFKMEEIYDLKDFSPLISELEMPAEQLLEYHLMRIQKKPIRSSIYRGSRIDSIKALYINKNGSIEGIVQIIGLFTSDFYKTSPLDAPWLREKAEAIYKFFSFSPRSHNERLLRSIIDSIPLDEFYYLSEKELNGLIIRALNMYDRNAISVRADEFGHSLSVLVYIPKYRYSENLRYELGNLISNEFEGELTSTHGYVSDASFARIIYILSFDSNKKFSINIEDLEEKIWIVSQTWKERFDYFCKKKSIHNNINFSPLYLKLHDPKVAADDSEIIQEWLKTDENIYFETKTKDDIGIIRVFQRDIPLTLGQIVPIFTNFQLNIQAEQTFFADFKGQVLWIHSYAISNLAELNLSLSTTEKLLQGLKAAWFELIEVDPFNALTVTCNLDFKEIIVLRAYGRFLKQLGFNYSQKALVDCLITYPTITQLLVEYFKEGFSPQNSKKGKLLSLENLKEKIFQEFAGIKRLDHDRIMRRFQNVIMSTVRTNAYQSGSLMPYPCLSFKAQSTQIIDVPKPSPFVEIFVYSPTMEGCHLRGGKIARGGIRWSDRPEDFRQEVLGLMKAQMVKNSIIVPIGSKGGFVVKNYTQLQESGYSANELKLRVINAYKQFIEQLLTITDNLVENKIETPKNLISYDEEDPYLVVAADKGTATFSDIANEISGDFNFWLGDAFASGGSKGYDHKKLGITARGAWIAVRRHFWELGIDCQISPITTVAVGDMAGDVFGNGMLQSTKIRLLAAFNHKHVFLDPNPNTEISYQERKRLFTQETSSWADYNSKNISKGGGVYDRSEKSIQITPEVAKVFDIEEDFLAPDELINRILQAQVDLLYFGGIGTFIKSQLESHTLVADRANDSVRIDAKMVRAKVIGEGANLGVTQQGRIEYALNGGYINTDAIDNSAGVDCSDHEVNLKIMCEVLLQEKIIQAEQRDELLANLADEVSELVLEDNWMQTLILTRMQEESKVDLNAYTVLIKNLEKHSSLPLRRNLENIPSDEDLVQRKNTNFGLTRPELAVLLAYSKIHLSQDLLHSLRNTACFGEIYYQQYFPKLFQTKYKDYLKHHPLKIEITATVLANLIINTMGPCFIEQMSEAFRVDALEVVRAFVEVLEQTGFEEQLKIYKFFDHNKKKTLEDLRNITRNIAQCTMVRLSLPEYVFAWDLKSIAPSKVPFSVLFAYHVNHSGKIDIHHIESSYKKLGIAFLWNWVETICPATSWQTGSSLLLQHDMIKTIAQLCKQTWFSEKLAAYNSTYDQLKNHIASTTDPSQHLLLLDYIIRQLQMLIVE